MVKLIETLVEVLNTTTISSNVLMRALKTPVSNMGDLVSVNLENGMSVILLE